MTVSEKCFGVLTTDIFIYVSTQDIVPINLLKLYHNFLMLRHYQMDRLEDLMMIAGLR